MPAVLIETGFATNKEEEKFLASESGETKMAESIFQAFANYKKETEGDKYGGMSKTYYPSSGGDFKEDDNKVTNNSNNTNNTQQEENKEDSETVNKDEVLYKVQFLSSKSELDLSSKTFKSIKKVSFVLENGWYKYMSGETNSLTSAKSIKSDLVNLGYKDAFIVSFKGTEKLTNK
jgi:N-acetylmuramoyl-L-alanine amidase